jgi:hypothetical protein
MLRYTGTLLAQGLISAVIKSFVEYNRFRAAGDDELVCPFLDIEQSAFP